MVREAALITVSCVLFVQMGLADAVQDVLRIRPRVLSCPKCVTFWCCLAGMLVRRNGLIASVAASFISAYAAMWLALVYDALALLYNWLYESITKNPGVPEAAEERSPSGQECSDALPEMPQD